MLQKLSEVVADCYRGAREARERAEGAADQAEELDYLAMERRWLLLAQSYELVERLSDFRSDAYRRVAALFSQQSDPTVPPCPSCGKAMQRMRINPPGAPARFAQIRFECETCDVTALPAGPKAGD